MKVTLRDCIDQIDSELKMMKHAYSLMVKHGMTSREVANKHYLVKKMIKNIIEKELKK